MVHMTMFIIIIINITKPVNSVPSSQLGLILKLTLINRHYLTPLGGKTIMDSTKNGLVRVTGCTPDPTAHAPNARPCRPRQTEHFQIQRGGDETRKPLPPAL